MCDSRGRQTRDWRPFVRDMIEFGERVLLYTDGLGQDAFVNDMRTYDAVLRNLELIGEAATHIPGHVRSAHPDIDWRSVIAARNRVAHGIRALTTMLFGTSFGPISPTCYSNCAVCWTPPKMYNLDLPHQT